MITKSAIKITPQSLAKASKAVGSAIGRNLDPFTVGMGALGVASGWDSVGGVVGGATGGTAGYRLGKRLADRFLSKNWKGRWLGELGSMALAMPFGTYGSAAGNKFFPIWKRKNQIVQE